MDEKIINISMELIAISGNAKSLGLEAVKLAKNNDYKKAVETYNEAKKELTKVHQIHASLLSEEANGEKMDISLLFIHSQDHLTSAIIILDLAEHLIELYNR